MKGLFFIILCFVFSSCFSSNKVSKNTLPLWVVDINSFDDKTLSGSSGYQYCLLDFQDNIIEKSLYKHYVVKVLNSEGVQAKSDINISFDPLYQKLQFHKLQIIRKGNIIDKLKTADIKVIQREKSLERSIYDGSLSAVINLTDVRENDVIEYSYTIFGLNPINQGNYSTILYHQYTIPVNRVYNRLIVDKNKSIKFKYFDGASKPSVKNNSSQTEYLWDITNVPFKLYDNNVPAWFDNQKRVSLSTYKDWEDVVNWALPLYIYSEQEINHINKTIDIKSTDEKKIIDLIRFVQDNIRYFGFETGINAYKPNTPLKVFNQRFGDCKDKSLLLVALLQSNGIVACPVLVNSQLKQEINNQLPSNSVFDHCIVYFKYKEKDYFIDPTISNQGGSLDNIAPPPYKKALLIKAGQSELIDIAENEYSKLTIKEIITLKSINDNAELMVRSEYIGDKADYIRSYFNTNSKEHVQKEFLDYYSSLYADIEVVDEMRIYDNERNTINRVVIEEFYNVKKFWGEAKDGSSFCETYPLVLESLLNYPKYSERKMPYFLALPHVFSQTTTFYLPEEWKINDANVLIEGEAFKYENIIKGYGKSITITHNYDLKKEFIDGSEVNLFLEKHGDIKKELSYYLTYNANLAGFKLSWLSIIIALLATGLGVFFAIKLYKKFNPTKWEYAEDKSIGGWLILPTIGITITPLVLFVQVITEGHFNQNTWSGLANYEFNQSVWLTLFLGAEIIYNFLFIVFAILILILFYQRKTSVPILISIFYALSFIVPLIDLLIVEQLLPNITTQAELSTSYREIIQSFIAAAIWIPYFNISERAKSTFCKVYQSDDIAIESRREN